MKTYRSAPSPRTEEKLQQLRDLLPAGRETPMPTFLLCGILECKPRQLQEWVAELRGRGELIGSSCGWAPGFFLCVTPEDVEYGLAHIFRRARSSFDVAKAMSKTAREQFGPETPTLFEAV